MECTDVYTYIKLSDPSSAFEIRKKEIMNIVYMLLLFPLLGTGKRIDVLYVRLNMCGATACILRAMSLPAVLSTN